MILSELVANLQAQVHAHRLLLDGLSTESMLKADCTLADLHALHDERDQMQRLIQGLENQRLALLQQYLNQHQLKGQVRLKDVAAHAGGPEAEALLEAREQLLALVEAIEKAGRENALKAVARINCFQAVQEEVHKSFKRRSLYAMNGKIKPPQGSVLYQKSV